MGIKGPTPKQREEFLERVMMKYNLDRRSTLNLLSHEIGTLKGDGEEKPFKPGTSVKSWFSDRKSSSYRDCPFSVWRLWHITLLNEDPLMGYIKKEHFLSWHY